MISHFMDYTDEERRDWLAQDITRVFLALLEQQAESAMREVVAALEADDDSPRAHRMAGVVRGYQLAVDAARRTR